MEIEVAGSEGRPVRATVVGDEDAPAVLVCHGFKGFRAWGLFPWLADRLAAAGLRAVRFDFSHNGVEARDFDRLDLFLLDTWTRHQEDLRALAGRFPGRIGLVGHSRGGLDALLFAREESRVACVATLAAPATTEPPPGSEEAVRERGYLVFPNARTGQDMPVARTALDDARRHDAEAAVRALAAPTLLVHGTADETVPVAALDRLAGWRGPDAEVLRVEDAGHTFGAVHPWQGPTPALETVADALAAFLARHLLAGTTT